MIPGRYQRGFAAVVEAAHWSQRLMYAWAELLTRIFEFILARGWPPGVA